MALMRFSMLCWTWKPSTSSGTSGSSSTRSRIDSSPSALRTSSSATARASGLGNAPPLGHSLVTHRAFYRPPLLSVLLADHHHVSWNQHPSQDPVQTHRLIEAITDLTLNHQEVEITPIISISTSTRA